MDILISPNFAYLLLVVAFVLALLAIVTPGTGALEIGTLVCIAIAGFAAIRIGINLWALIILLLALVPYVYAVRKSKREWALIISLIAIVIGSAYLFPSKGFIPSVNPILVIIVSIIWVSFIWMVVHKALQAYLKPPSHNLEVLIGQVGEAKTEIYTEGSAQVAGELWTARSVEKIPAGTFIRVIGREGFVLLVEKSK